MHNLDPFFNPKSVAVIGASRDQQKLGHVILENLKISFKGQLYPINPNAEEILGLKAYQSVLDVKEPIDHAVIVVPAEVVNKTISECIKKKIKVASVISSGFSEIGNKKLEEELKIISKGRIRVLGPNCMAVYKKDLDMIFHPRTRLKRPPEGFIAFISQSGAFGSILLDSLAYDGVGVSTFISLGNKVDVDETELIDYLEEDTATRCIGMYVETVSRGEEFIKTAKRVAAKKPIVVFKAGKTDRGREAVVSHTGSLAGPAEIYSAAFKQAGIIEARNSEELFDLTKALANLPVMKDNKVCIVTDGGGFGIVATDAAIMNGLDMNSLSPETTRQLKAFLPPYASINNPIDLTGDATVERYRKTLETVLKDKNVSGVVVIVLMQIPTLTDEIVDVLRDVKVFGKPLTVCSAGSQFVLDKNRKLESYGIPTYPTPERAVRALAALYEYGKIKRKLTTK